MSECAIPLPGTLHSIRHHAVAPRIGRAAHGKVWVVTGLLGRNAARRVILQHAIDQIETVGIQAGHEPSCRLARPLGEGCFEVGERRHARPSHLVGCAEQPESQPRENQRDDDVFTGKS